MTGNDAEGSPSALERKIVKQIEFYFGDKNLPRDKFLLQKIEEDDGWITFDTLLTFKRLKNFVEDVIADLLSRHGSGVVEVNKDKRKLRRVTPLPEDSEEANSLAKEKTVYCKGFPEDATLDDIEDFFEGKGKCIFIKMRRRIDDARTFKGSVFVEFATKEEAEAFLETKGLKYGDTELVYMSKDAYFKSKRGEKFKKGGEKNGEKKEQPEEEKKPKVPEYEKGCVIHFSGVGEQTSREDIKELFDLEGLTVSWVNFNRGDKEGHVRFTKEGDGEKAIKAVNEAHDKVTLRGVETTLRVLEGDEEKTYWVGVSEEKEKFKKKGGKRQPHRHNSKRGRQEKDEKSEKGEKSEKDDKSDEPPKKQIKTEET